MMIWVSALATISGSLLVLKGRQYDLAAPLRLEEEEGPTAAMGLGILLMFLGGALGILTGSVHLLGH